MFPHYSAVGEETKRSFPPSGHEGLFSGGVFPLKIKNNSMWADLRGSSHKFYPVGIGTSIAILLRASIKRLREGWFFVKRSIKPRDRSTTLPGSWIIKNRKAFMRLRLQDFSSTRVCHNSRPQFHYQLISQHICACEFRSKSKGMVSAVISFTLNLASFPLSSLKRLKFVEKIRRPSFSSRLIAR